TRTETMDTDDGKTTARANRLGEILGAYFVAVEEGRAHSRQDLLAQHPDLASELAEYFAEQVRLDRVEPGPSPNRPPVHRGSADRRPVAASRHRAGLRAGCLCRPTAVLRHEAGQGAD